MQKTTNGGKSITKTETVTKKAWTWERIRFHDLRHTFATLALQNGVDVKTVSAMLGHSNAGFTLATYKHTTTAAQQQAAAIMGSLVGTEI